jgi:hypothetical protein
VLARERLEPHIPAFENKRRELVLVGYRPS